MLLFLVSVYIYIYKVAFIILVSVYIWCPFGGYKKYKPYTSYRHRPRRP